ncbi:hypothetical protein G6011_06550 [Alternaria panax]|uniref:DUF7587 domain-containing protein n=1 Tax=Alternaria panax TaxID=48097 RepID=A0AAD4FGL9_9PLEO|nr:hypothetical protein G6011_06550 [Alternaria panax]
MTRHIWRATDAGMMLWEPAVEATVTTKPQESPIIKQEHIITEEDIQVTLASSHNDSEDSSDEQDLVLPSIEEFFGSYIKSEPDLGTPPDATRYASESTESSSSPCPLTLDKVRSTKLLDSSETNRRFEISGTERTPPVRRTLNFGMVTLRKTTDVATQHPVVSNVDSLNILRKLERGHHSWDEDERELLTILYRWYDDSDVTTLPQIFNAITGLDIKLSCVRNHFERDIVYYGGCVYPEFDRATKVLFHDPARTYEYIHATIKETASEYGIKLSRREVEKKYASGRAKDARSPTIRRYYRSRVKQVAEKQRQEARAMRTPALQDSPLRPLPLGGMTMVTDPIGEDAESWLDTEYQSIPQVTPARSPREVFSQAYSIAFRAYDESSFTKHSEKNGFMSSRAHIWPSDKLLPPPLDPNGETRPYFMMDAHNHLSMSGGTSPYITVCTSLLQTLAKASNMQHPRIAVVALDHPLLQEPNRILHAAETIRMLKSEGLIEWARYEGHADNGLYLQDLADSDERSANLLSLEEFRPGRATKHISDKLRHDQFVLKKNSARRIAAVARTFKMDGVNVKLAHIQDFVACFVDGWKINENPLDGSDARIRIAAAFATTLASRAHRAQDVMHAFQDGFQQGAQTIAYYSRRRPTTRHPCSV